MIDLQKSSNFEKNIENICTYYVKVHKKGHFLKKILAFAIKRWYHTFVVLCLDTVRTIFRIHEGGAAQWQNVNFVTKKLLSASRFLTHTDVQTEHGNPTLKELKQS